MKIVHQAGYLRGSYQDARSTKRKIILSICFRVEWNTYFELTTHLPRSYDFRDDCTQVQFRTFNITNNNLHKHNQHNHIKKKN